jgi:hypothetical protein
VSWWIQDQWIGELLVLSGQDQPVDREEARPVEPTQAEGLGSPDPQVRITALEQWAQHREGDSVDPLSHALVDPDEQVRARAQALWEEALARQAEAAQFSVLGISGVRVHFPAASSAVRAASGARDAARKWRSGAETARSPAPRLCGSPHFPVGER